MPPGREVSLVVPGRTTLAHMPSAGRVVTLRAVHETLPPCIEAGRGARYRGNESTSSRAEATASRRLAYVLPAHEYVLTLPLSGTGQKGVIPSTLPALCMLMHAAPWQEHR